MASAFSLLYAHSVFDNELGDDGERAISDANAKRATPLAKLRMGDY